MLMEGNLSNDFLYYNKNANQIVTRFFTLIRLVFAVNSLELRKFYRCAKEKKVIFMWNFADFMSSCVLLKKKKRKFDNRTI